MVQTKAEGGPARLQGRCGRALAGVASKFGFDFRPKFLSRGQPRLPQLPRQREDYLWRKPENEMAIKILRRVI